MSIQVEIDATEKSSKEGKKTPIRLVETMIIIASQSEYFISVQRLERIKSHFLEKQSKHIT